ncbi:wall-associated receptor kinase-like 1 [Chenopodium quinoa]|uniref:wall-associated receptor kinase-like 1 n=1 Tax=Chenopodium quinoa TaxID=63459 RepID=UPI000B7882B7|nr:wall-associated receptor kinase-like 1 [Chenopodium quinoa]
MLCLLLLLLQLESFLWLAAGGNISMPNCPDHCGNVKIPYPFGIGPNCYHDKWYEIICNSNNNSVLSPKPFLRHFNLEVLDINWPGRYSPLGRQVNDQEADDQRLIVNLLPKNFCGSSTAVFHGFATSVVKGVDFNGSPFRYSRWFNVFMVEGCGGSVVLQKRGGEIMTGCASVCSNEGVSMNKSNCYGVGCCQASLLSSPTGDYLNREEGLDFYQIALDYTGFSNFSTCNVSAALIESYSVKKLSGKLSNLKAFPAVLEWTPKYIMIPRKKPYMNYDNFSCNYDNNNAVSCTCGFPYEGNPFLPDGCQVVTACHKCRDRCDMAFSDDKGYYTNYYCKKNHKLELASILAFSIGLGLVLLVLGCYWLYKFVKKRKEMKLKAKYFKINGGLLLQQQMSSTDGVVENTKIFAATELEKATDGFSESRILGQGGQGTVYKGMLLDGRIVAIKKSKKVDESQLEQFINEVVILSQINHRNVVKLIGCCLETEVPLLVYEFVYNGTLYQHLHNDTEDFHVSWKMRLQIAAESAGALAYLHSSSSAPIYHRDIKSSNILLDEKFRAKVSDFGTSRAITIEQTHVTTCVLGTYGYLDPEYFQSNQFTEKSDVYSFGVVLVELITGKKPICPTKEGGWISLAVEFLSYMESSSLSDILDARVVDEGKEEEFVVVANLARQCLEMKGKQRPTMKEIAVLLDGIRSHHPPNFREPIPPGSKHVVTEMVSTHSGPFSVEMLSSDDGPSNSMEVQPLMVNI